MRKSSLILVIVLLSVFVSPVFNAGSSVNSSSSTPIIQISKVSWYSPPFNDTAKVLLTIIYAENVRAYALRVEVSLPEGIYNSTGGNYVVKCVPVTTTQGNIEMNFTVHIGNVTSKVLELEENQFWFLDDNVSMVYNVSVEANLTYLGDPVPFVTFRNQTLTLEDVGTAPLYNITVVSQGIYSFIPYLNVGSNYSINVPRSHPDYNVMFSAETPYHEVRTWNESFSVPLKLNVELTASPVSSLYSLLPGYNLVLLKLTSNSLENMTVLISSSDAFVTPDYVQVKGNSTIPLILLTTGSISTIQVSVQSLGRQVYSSNFSWIVSQPSQYDVPFKVYSKVVGNEVYTSVHGSFLTNVSLCYGGVLVHKGVPPFNTSFPFDGDDNVTIAYQVNGSVYRTSFPIQDIPNLVSFPFLKIITIQKQVVSSDEIVLLVGIYNYGNSSAYDVDVVGSSPEQSSPSAVEVESQIQPNETVFVPVYIYGSSDLYNVTVKIFYSSQGKPQVITKDVVINVPSKPTPVGEVISVLSVSYDGIPILFVVPMAILLAILLFPRKK